MEAVTPVAISSSSVSANPSFSSAGSIVSISKAGANAPGAVLGKTLTTAASLLRSTEQPCATPWSISTAYLTVGTYVSLSGYNWYNLVPVQVGEQEPTSTNSKWKMIEACTSSIGNINRNAVGALNPLGIAPLVGGVKTSTVTSIYTGNQFIQDVNNLSTNNTSVSENSHVNIVATVLGVVGSLLIVVVGLIFAIRQKNRVKDVEGSGNSAICSQQIITNVTSSTTGTENGINVLFLARTNEYNRNESHAICDQQFMATLKWQEDSGSLSPIPSY
ncbi:hypothetical protein HK100_010804 [Physocladia obscura]|uniref:Chitin-binding type-3 domain-containing protein n=1 Tax=Physocladia obscura TaxID=109957 RepID=A0AAD5TBE3_9FUNG|nr:hypothetical protein HK100_010804 [Physocladia obscura]